MIGPDRLVNRADGHRYWADVHANGIVLSLCLGEITSLE